MDLDHDSCYRALRERDARFDGSFFVAVRTTGVYCRPICPARTPRIENVTFHRSAAAAQAAGYRPCRRCRPERAPQIASGTGVPRALTRALAWLEARGLGEGGVPALAERVGLSERQLRRLFRDRMGASPVQVEQTRRLLLAKQLLHETRLPITEVAYASGFGSVRRFNEAFAAAYACSPASLRRTSPRDGDWMPGGELCLMLSYRPPYDWDAMLAFFSRRAIPGVETLSGDTYSRTLSIGPDTGTVAVRPAARHALEACIRFPRVSAVPSIIGRLRRVFDLATDTAPIEAHLAEDPLLATIVAARPGLRVPGSWDGFEMAVRAILGQQITVTAAATLAGRLVSRYGRPLDRPLEGLTHAFPDASALVSIDASRLGMPGNRAETLAAVARAAEADAEFFGFGADLDDVVRRLRGVKGIGEWTAQYIALRHVREPDAFPAADVGLMRAVERAEGARPDPKELLARAERWRPWRAYAAQHLWTSAASISGTVSSVAYTDPSRPTPAPSATHS